MNQQAAVVAQRAELMRKIAEGRMQVTAGATTPAGSSRCVCLKVGIVSICKLVVSTLRRERCGKLGGATSET